MALFNKDYQQGDVEADQLSDGEDEVFFGKLTLKEIKKHIFLDRQPWSISALSSPVKTNPNDPNTSLKIIKTQSQPNLRSGQVDYEVDYNSPALSPCMLDEVDNDSYRKIENMVDHLYQTPKNKEKSELNNTLEVIEYILNNPPTQNVDVKPETGNSKPLNYEEKSLPMSPLMKQIKSENNSPTENVDAKPETGNSRVESITYEEKNESRSPPMKHIKSENISNNTPTENVDAISVSGNIEPISYKEKTEPKSPSNKHIVKSDINDLLTSLIKVPTLKNREDAVKKDMLKPAKTPTRLCTPRKDNYATPMENKGKPIFKTPGQPLSQKKPTATPLKITSKMNTYEHISSPVASYIKKTPIVPLVKEVHPKKPLPGPSSIPKYVKSYTPTACNKENVVLPSVAYKSAKKTKIIDIPDESKLPQSHWIKKITTSLPKPMVTKHSHREVNLAKKVSTPQQENSFADLTYHQAEVSVCTQKSAFKLKNNN